MSVWLIAHEKERNMPGSLFKSVFRYWGTLGFLVILICPVVFGEEVARLPIRFGASTSLTGKWSDTSFMVRNAYLLWVEKINRSGGLLGRPVELVLYDDKSRVEICRGVYERLILEDKVDFVLSPYGSELTFPASEVAALNGHVMVAGSGANKLLWERGYHGFFGIHNSIDRYFISFLDMIARQRLKRVSVIYEKASQGDVAVEGIRKWAGVFGMAMADVVVFDDVNTELPALIKALNAKKPGVLIWLSWAESCYTFLNALKESVYQPRILTCIVTPTFPDFYERAGQMAEGVFAPSLWEPDERMPFPDSADFIKEFTQFSGKMPTYNAAGSFAACQILERAVTTTQSLDHQKISQAIAAMDTITVTGNFKVDEKGLQIGHKALTIQWQNGKKEIVYPRCLQTAVPVFKE